MRFESTTCVSELTSRHAFVVEVGGLPGEGVHLSRLDWCYKIRSQRRLESVRGVRGGLVRIDRYEIDRSRSKGPG
jgi:hypothetical protein